MSLLPLTRARCRYTKVRPPALPSETALGADSPCYPLLMQRELAFRTAFVRYPRRALASHPSRR